MGSKPHGTNLSPKSAASTVCRLDATLLNSGIGVMGERSPAADFDPFGSHTAQCATLIAPYAGYG